MAKRGPKELHGGHTLTMTPKLYLALGEDLKRRLIERSHLLRITATDLIRLFIAKELGIEFSPNPGFTPMKGGSTFQAKIGVEWKERLQQVRDLNNKSMPTIIKENLEEAA